MSPKSLEFAEPGQFAEIVRTTTVFTETNLTRSRSMCFGRGSNPRVLSVFGNDLHTYNGFVFNVVQVGNLQNRIAATTQFAERPKLDLRKDPETPVFSYSVFKHDNDAPNTGRGNGSVKVRSFLLV